MSVYLPCAILWVVLRVLPSFKDCPSTGACLEVSLSAELKELAGGVQRLLVVTSSDQSLRIPSLCFNPALQRLPYITLCTHHGKEQRARRSVY